MSVTAIGSIALDSLSLPTGEYPEILGGSASHFATSCSLFTDVAIVGVVGEDFHNDHILYFKDRNIDTSGLQVVHGKTFRWKGKYEKEAMDQAITLDTQLNVFETFHPEIPEKLAQTDFVFLGNIHPKLQKEVAQKTTAKLKVLDTMNLWIAATKEDLIQALAEVDVLIFNETEAREFTGRENLKEAAKAVLDMGPKVVVIKRGGEGAMLVSAEDLFFVGGYPVEQVIDPTGAGDSFAGGLVGYLGESGDISRESLRRAVVYGNIMGSFNVQGVGTKVLSQASREEVDKRFEAFKRMMEF